MPTIPAGPVTPVTVSIESVSHGNASLANGYSYVSSTSHRFRNRVSVRLILPNAVGNITFISPTGGPLAGGTVVTINGTDLGNGNDIKGVLFGATPATVINQTATSVRRHATLLLCFIL